MDNARIKKFRDTEDIQNQYVENERKKTLTTGRIASAVGIISIILFLTQDIYLLEFYDFIPWRIFGIAAILSFLFFSFILSDRYPVLIIPMYILSLTGVIIMTCGITAMLFYRHDYGFFELNGVSTGLLVTIFAVFIFSSGARKYIPVMVFIPLLSLGIILILMGDLSMQDWTSLSNPLFAAIIVSISSVYQERLNFNEFSSRKHAEMSDRIISIQHNSMATMLDSIDESAFLMKPDGIILYANKTMAERVNTPHEHLPGMNAYDVTPQEVRESRREMVSCCTETKEPVRFIDERNGRSILNSIRPVIDENNEVVYLAVFGFDITERIRSENEIKRLLDEKKLLLKEVHHRIKNNMMSISGLLTLRSESDVNAECAAILKEMSGRVMAMMRIYDKLYRSEEYSHIHLREYLGGLLDEISRTFISGDSISIAHEIEDLYIRQNSVFAIGIIVNELVINALKYAFPDGRKGIISINLRKTGDNEIEIVIHDNGIGLPDPETITLKAGFGLDLVKIMVQQSGGRMTVSSDNGTIFTINIPNI